MKELTHSVPSLVAPGTLLAMRPCALRLIARLKSGQVFSSVEHGLFGEENGVI